MLKNIAMIIKSLKILFVSLVCLVFPMFGNAKHQQKPMYSAIVFDCDGVLVDTEYLKFIAWKEVLKKHNVEFELKEYMPLIGYNSDYILKNINVIKKSIYLKKLKNNAKSFIKSYKKSMFHP